MLKEMTRTAAGLFAVILAAAAAAGAPQDPARADVSATSILIDNQTSQAIRVAGPGGSAVIEPSAAPRRVTFDSKETVGVTLRIWLQANPRQLCQIFTPWDRTVIVTNRADILCGSRQDAQDRGPRTGGPALSNSSAS